MPTVFSHAVAATAIGTWCLPPAARRGIWMTGAFVAAAPDLDVIAFTFGIPYGALLGHRGLSHSVAVAVVAGWVLAALASQDSGVPRGRLWLFYALAAASHGILDAFTNGGLGVALLAPFSGERFFAPVRPIEVSPIGVEPFVSGRGLSVIRNEIAWIWLPALGLAAAGLAARRVPADGRA